MSNVDLGTLRLLTNLAREAVVARERGETTPDGLDLQSCEEAIAIAESALAHGQATDRVEKLEEALADCYDVVHRLRHGYRESELPKNPACVETAARELLGIREPRVQPID